MHALIALSSFVKWRNGLVKNTKMSLNREQLNGVGKIFNTTVACTIVVEQMSTGPVKPIDFVSFIECNNPVLQNKISYRFLMPSINSFELTAATNQQHAFGLLFCDNAVAHLSFTSSAQCKHFQKFWKCSLKRWQYRSEASVKHVKQLMSLVGWFVFHLR